MDVFEAIKGRRTIRHFTEKPVPEDIFKKIIDAARWAPSACNRQGWRFIVIKNKEQIEKLEKAGTVYFLKRIPLPILVLYDKRTDNTAYQDHIQSASAAIQNMFLAAHSLGLGMVWCDNLPSKRYIRKLFKIPWHYDIISLAGLGYYNKENLPKALPRKKEIEELYCYDYWSLNEEIPGRLNLKLRVKKFLRGTYHSMPLFIKKYLNPIAKKFEKKFDPKDTEVKEL